MRLPWMTLAALVAVTHTLPAQAATQLEQQLASCAAKADKLDRLVCYDDLAAKVATQSATPAPVAAPVVTSTAAPVAAAAIAPAAVATSAASADAVDEFGIQRKPAETQIEKIYLQVKDVDADPYGAIVITFDNGQVWKQTDSRKYKLKQGESVYIEKGALGSFLLGVDDRNGTIRVKRLQ